MTPRFFGRSPDQQAGGTGIVLLNMGGPATLDEVDPFLLQLFADRELLRLPFQDLLGPFIAKRRAPKVRKLYESIGGGSPILHWTRTQGRGMCERLDELSPATAPHRFYVAFRYVEPSAEAALRQMAADGVTRAIAFSQYPHYSCTTTGSSLTDLWRTVERLGYGGRFRWSIIDRWPTHAGFIHAMAEAVGDGLEQYDDADRDDVLLMFSAHSLPLSVIERGDSYPQEVGATVQAVLDELGLPNPSMLCFQSEVGPVRWLGPSTKKTIETLARAKRHNVLAVPIAFVNDHIETLSELDREYGHLAHRLGLEGFRRAPALNDRPVFLDAMADLVHTHLSEGSLHSARYRERCPGCIGGAACRQLPDPANVATPAAKGIRVIA